MLPAGRRVRRIPLGIGAGMRLGIDFRHETGLYLGLYEVELNRYLRELCQPGADCFDVGGHIGYDAIVLAKLTTGGRIVSFESDTGSCRMIEQSAHANGRVGTLISVENVYVDSRTDRGARRLSLDDFAYGPNGFRPDFVKIDVEGGEVAVLSGAVRLLSERQPHLIVETHSPALERECVRLLRAQSYEPAVVKQRRWLPDNRPAGAVNRWLIARGVAKPQPGAEPQP